MKIKELFIDAYSCEGNLNNTKIILKSVLKAAKLVNAKVVKTLVYNYKPYGVSVVVLLAETHISIYTWPEYRYASVEIFLCNEKMDANLAWKEIEKALLPKKISKKKILRNIQ